LLFFRLSLLCLCLKMLLSLSRLLFHNLFFQSLVNKMGKTLEGTSIRIFLDYP
jgi:hypothetical protein